MASKIKNNLIKYKWVYITFILSSIVISSIFILQKIAPFGKNSMLDVDFYHQYGPLLNELYDRVKSGESLLYSFNTGGGVPFFRNFLNYLSSPFNIVLFLFKKENIIMAFSIIIALKAIFASVTMSFFLKKTFKKDNFLICIFGLLYSYSGYFCAYYWNIMWLDGMVFLPLIALGISKIVDDKKPIVYILSLSLMLFANYFIAYMICIFSVIYFLGYFWYKKGFKVKEFIISSIYFGISSILAAGLVSFALIPLYSALSSISATTDSFPIFKYSFKLSDFLFNHITGVSRTVFASDELPLPNIYSGLITIALIIALFLNKKVNLKMKVLVMLFFAVFISSFMITSVDFIWHAFHVPNDLPWRYSFIYVFCFVSFSYYSCIKLKDFGVLKFSICFMITIIFVLLSSKMNFVNINNEKVIMCVILLLIYYLLYFLHNFKASNSKITNLIFTIFIMFECVYGININWDIAHDIKNFMSNKPSYEKLISDAKKDDNGLYRMEKTSYLTLNDGAWYDYYGMSTFSSMAYESTSKAQRMLGIAGNNINSYYYQGFSNPIYNTMFNVKYIMGDYIENDYYVPIENYDTYSLTGYNYSSSFVYLVNNDMKKWSLVSYNPFDNYKSFVKLSTGKENILTGVNITDVFGGKITPQGFANESNGEFYYELDKPGTVLTLTLDTPFNDNIYLYLSGNNVSSYNINGQYFSITSDEYYIVDTGKLKDKKTKVEIHFKNSSSGSIKFYAYKIDDKVFKEFYSTLEDGFLNVKEYSDTYIYGNLTANEDKMAFASISYDKGWKVFVDGKITNTYKVADSYLAFDVKKGKHEIKLIYYPENMKLGLIISLASFTITIVYAAITRKKYLNYKKK